MSQSFSPFPSSEARSPVQAYGAAIYTHPDDVTSDPKLTTAEKRAVLASWISDARAVKNVPSLRRLDSSAVVEVDAVLRAPVLLDKLALIGNCKQAPPLGRRCSVISRWLRRGSHPNRSNDNDDDDPPPAPAGFGTPFRPKPLWPAQGARPERGAALACAPG
jgi:hypothetical protein